MEITKHMTSPKTEEPKLEFHEENEDDHASIFLLEDLIKEYNQKILNGPSFIKGKKYPLSLRLPNLRGDQTIIRPMTMEEIEAMNIGERKENDWMIFKEVLKDQVTPKGVISKIPHVAAGVTLIEIIKELGLHGKIYYKTLGEKIYVILKGNSMLRSILKGTRYLNTHPEIVRLGLAKVNVTTALKIGFKTSLIFYGAAKAAEGIQMYLEDGELRPSFFTDVPAELTKLMISNLIGTAVGTVIVVAGTPLAVGAGIALVVGIGVGIGLDYLDKKISFTKTVSNATEEMWKNLKEWWNTIPHTEVQAKKGGAFFPSPFFLGNPLVGFAFSGQLAHSQRIIQRGDHFVYTA